MKQTWRLILLIIFIVSVYQFIREMLQAVHLEGIFAKLRQRTFRKPARK